MNLKKKDDVLVTFCCCDKIQPRQLMEESLTELVVPEEQESTTWGGIASSRSHGSSIRKLSAHVFKHKQKAENKLEGAVGF